MPDPVPAASAAIQTSAFVLLAWLVVHTVRVTFPALIATFATTLKEQRDDLTRELKETRSAYATESGENRRAFSQALQTLDARDAERP